MDTNRFPATALPLQGGPQLTGQGNFHIGLVKAQGKAAIIKSHLRIRIDLAVTAMQQHLLSVRFQQFYSLGVCQVRESIFQGQIPCILDFVIHCLQ